MKALKEVPGPGSKVRSLKPMKSLLLFLALFAASLARAVVPITGPLGPTFSGAVYPTHDAQFGKGGLLYWTNRLTVPTPRRAGGMMVYQTSDSTFWRLGDDVSTWTQVYLPATDVEALKASLVQLGSATNDLAAAQAVTNAALSSALVATNAALVAAQSAASAAQSAALVATNSALVASQAAASAAQTAALVATNNLLQSAMTAGLLPKWAQPFQPSASGLTLTIGPGVYTDAAGNAYTFAGASTNLVDPQLVRGISSYTNHIYLINGRLVPFSRGIHRGGIYLGAFVSTHTAITSLNQPTSFNFKKSRLTRWLPKQIIGLLTRVFGIGDSIQAGSSASNGSNWFALCFNSSYSAYGFNVRNVANVTTANYGTPGASVLAGLAFTGDLIAATKTGVGVFPSAAAHRTPANNALDTVNQKVMGQGKQWNLLPDLCAFGYGNTYAAGDANQAAVQTETALRRLRWRGCDTVLHTEQPFYGNGYTNAPTGWTLNADAARIRTIADATGSELVDTYGALQWQVDAGNADTFYNPDRTHPNDAGHNVWAFLMNSVIDPVETRDYETVTPGVRSQYYSGTNYNQIGSGLDLYMDYAAVSGTGTNGGDPVSSSLNLNTICTGAATTNNVYNLSVSNKWHLMHGGCLSAYLVTSLPSGQSANCHLEDQFGTQLGASFQVFGGFGQQYTKMLLTSDLSTNTATLLERGNNPNRLPVYAFDEFLMVDSLSGGATVLPCVSAMFETPIRKSINVQQWGLTGTWASELSSGTHETTIPVWYTDALNSQFATSFTGDMLEMWMVWGSAAGKHTIVLDGETVANTAILGTRSGAGYIYHLYLQQGNSPYNTTTQKGYHVAPGTKNVGIKLAEVGTSPVTANRSFQILAVNELIFDLLPMIRFTDLFAPFSFRSKTTSPSP